MRSLWLVIGVVLLLGPISPAQAGSFAKLMSSLQMPSLPASPLSPSHVATIAIPVSTPDDLSSAIVSVLDRVSQSKPVDGHAFAYEAPYRTRSLFGTSGIAFRVIMPSETLSSDQGLWDEFEITAAYSPPLPTPPAAPAGPALLSGIGTVTVSAPAAAIPSGGTLKLLVSDFRTSKRAVFNAEKPSFDLSFLPPDPGTQQQMEDQIAELLKRFVEQAR